jgi:hypothetical protein
VPRSLWICPLLLVLAAHLPGAVIYTYDFPGSPGSGLAADQTNPQPSFATFGDFTRTGAVSAGGGTNVFDTKGWSPATSIDLSQYQGFSITASPWYVLNLTSVSFSFSNSGNGPNDFQASLFLNGSSTPYQSQSYSSTQGLITTLTFDFTDLVTADNVTSATVRFYGWNTASAGAHLVFDDVAVSGSIAALPEPSNAWFGIAAAVGAAGLTFIEAIKRGTRIKSSGSQSGLAVAPSR